MWPAYCKAQFVEEKAIEDANGNLRPYTAGAYIVFR